MPTHRTLSHTLSILIVLTMLLAAQGLPAASARRLDGLKHQVNHQTGKVNFFGSGDLNAMLDADPTPTSLLTETPIPTGTPIPAETMTATATIIPTGELISSEEISEAAPDEITTLAGATWYVSPQGNNSNTCNAPGSPCAAVNAVLAKPGFVANDVIKVAVGTYTYAGYDPYVVIVNKNAVLSGGWDLAFNSQIGFSVVDGQSSRGGISTYDSQWGGENVSIDRFIVKNSSTGIYSMHQLTVTNSSIHSNSRGGITHFGTSLILNNVVISNNNNSGGEGGGILTGKSSVTMNNVTISQNHGYAGGGIYHSPYYGQGTLSIRLSNTIISGNIAQTTGPDCNAPMTSTGHNIIGDTTGCTITAGTGDRLNVNPQLGTFIPQLGYHPILPASPAINAGVGCYGTADQRGALRVDACDIGAYEYIPPGPVASITMISGDHQTSAPNLLFKNPLQVMALDSNGSPVPGVQVTFRAPVAGPSVTFTSSGNTTATYTTDTGGRATTSTIRANNQLGSYIITASIAGVGSSAEFPLENLAWYVATTGSDSNACKSPASPCATLEGALSKAVHGDKIFVAEGLYTDSGYQVAFIDKSVTISGGWNAGFTNQTGLSIIDGQNLRKGLNINTGVSVWIERFIIQHGVGTEDGGGIANAGQLTLNNSAIADNTAIHGGGIHNWGNLTLNNVTITNNTTSSHGGGIYNEGVISINNSTVSNNSTRIRGGGIYNEGAQYGESDRVVQIKNSILAGNVLAGTDAGNYGPDCAEGVISLGNNLIGSTSGCNIVAFNGDKFNVNPKLSTFLPALGYQPLQAGSPAINGGNAATCLPQDQRGASRVGVCDMGAYEYRAPGVASSIRAATNNLRLPPGSPANLPLQVVAIDQWGTPVSGVAITFTAPVTGPRGVFTNGTNSISANTGTDGIASAGFTTNRELGSYEIDAYSPALNMHTAIAITNFAWFVANTGNDSNNCYTPTTPCATINGALGKIARGDTIYVAQGRYIKHGNDYLSWIVDIRTSVTIIGGWNATFTNQGAPSLIDGEGNYVGVVNSGDNVTVSGLLIQNTSFGIDNGGSLTLDQVSVINNTGGGVGNHMGTLVIQNTTISQNQGHGLSNSEGTTIVKNSTITNNTVGYEMSSGGGIRTVNGTVTVTNTIVHGNSAEMGPDCYAYTTNSAIVSEGYNIIGTTSGCSVTARPGDQFNTDPLLLKLLTVGYQPLSAASPAIHGGNPSTCTQKDQRGFARLTDGTCDIGAYEYELAVRFVNRDARGTNTGTSWTNAYTDLQSALANTPSGYEIWVAAGTYKPVTGTDRTASFMLRNDLAIYGGFVGNETSRTQRNPVTNVTLLSGDIGVAGNASDNSYHVVLSKDTNNTAVLNGFTVTAGNANGVSPHNNGGGMFIENGNPVLSEMIFDGNVASDFGGGMYNSNAYPDLSNVTFRGNAGHSGGGMYNWQSNPELDSVTFSGNSADLNGGGMFNDSSYPMVMNVTFQGNAAASYGGGMFQKSGNPSLIQVTFSGNSAALAGGAIANDAGSPLISNSILYDNTGGEIHNFGLGSSPYVTHSIVKGGYPGINVLDADPHLGPLAYNGGFTQTMALLSGSYAIDAGDDENCTDSDQRGVHRPQDEHCDMGAYEAKGSIQISIGGIDINSYSLVPAESKRVSYAGINNGPVKIMNTDNVPVMAAERLIYKVNNVNTSFIEMMALPNHQLDTTYWLPWYNNVDLDTQLRFANVSDVPATVQVFIGRQEMPGSPFTLLAGESMRKSFPGVNNGPVKIQSNRNIVAAERLIYRFNGIATSFSETMAIPNRQLDTTYWLPWYNNKDLDTQLRFANVSTSSASVHVYIGGVEMTGSPFTLLAGESTRKSFPNINAGPVKIVSDHGVPIVAAERLIYKVNNVATSFTEMMALPNSALDTTYWLPWYNNKDLDTQLRFANTTSSTATVHVYIGGQEMTGSPFTLLAGESTRQSFAGVNNGPVQIVSDVPIVAAERLIYKVNNVATSFTEMMALPDSQLDTSYWLPWYNNVDLDTQLRFGVP